MDIERTPLPGIGLRHVVTTDHAHRVGVVSYHSGRRDLVVYRDDDPDTAAATVPLRAEEANAVAELLGSARVAERLDELHRQVTGLVSAQVSILATSPYRGRRLGETRARTRTGASIVAVVRDREVIASPGPDLRFEAGDVVVVVGTGESTDLVAAILGGG